MILLAADVVQSLVKFLDDRHLLVVEYDLVVVHNFQDSFCSQQAKVLIYFVRVYNFEHPENSGGVHDVLLTWRLVFNVEVDDVEELVQDPTILRV